MSQQQKPNPDLSAKPPNVYSSEDSMKREEI